MTKAELLVKIDAAIDSILTGNQAHSVLGRSYTKANLSDLWKIRKETEAAIANETRGGSRVFQIVPE